MRSWSEMRSRFGLRLRLWQGSDHGAVAAERAAGEKCVVCRADQLERDIISPVAIPSNQEICGFGASGQKPGELHVIRRHHLANLLEYFCWILEMEGLAQAEFFELVRQDPQKVKVRPGAHHFRGLVQQLDLPGGVGHATVLFIRR